LKPILEWVEKNVDAGAKASAAAKPNSSKTGAKNDSTAMKLADCVLKMRGWLDGS